MTASASDEDALFRDAVAGLEGGDFSRLEPLFDAGAAGARPKILEWFEQERFRAEPKALDEALTCACFLGRTDVAEVLLARGVDPEAGAATGLNAIHWAANRGQLEAVRLLIRRKVALETRNMYGGTALGVTVWSAIHEPRPAHVRIVEELLGAGARREAIELPTGHGEVDALLSRRAGGVPGERA